MEIQPSQLPERFSTRADFGAQVLVVEDVSINRDFLKHQLEEGGYQVTLAPTAQTAMEALSDWLPDLVLLDLMLPDADGLEVCRFLRTRPDGEDIPVLVTTVDEGPGSHAEAVRAGADDFLRKPLLPAELQTRVRSLIRLRQLRAELRRDREAIVTLQAQKDELLQFVVHDLKNMLGTLLVSVEMLEGDPAPQWTRQRQRIEDTARTMHGMVQSMLDLSVHEEVGLTAHPEEIQLEPWLARHQFEMEAVLLRRKQSLQLQVDPGLRMEGDPQLLQRVIFNLVENASKYAPSYTEIQLLASQAGSSVRIQVADLGEGIPAEKKASIFERFTRLQSGKGVPLGRGLGLAFCRVVMELHGGRIWVEDNHPKGSRFLLELPNRFARG